MKTQEQLNNLAYNIIGAAIEVHKELGPGLLESVYEECLLAELRLRHMKVVKQVPVPINYKGIELDKLFYVDLLVEDEIIIELKCVEALHPVHEVQVVTYLKLANKRLGYLMNFNVVQMKQGIVRKVNNF